MLPPFLVAEMADTGKHHGNTETVCRGDDVGILHRTAGLNDCRYAMGDRRFQAVTRRLPDSVEPVRLYESYLSNFQFSNGE